MKIWSYYNSLRDSWTRTHTQAPYSDSHIGTELGLPQKQRSRTQEVVAHALIFDFSSREVGTQSFSMYYNTFSSFGCSLQIIQLYEMLRKFFQNVTRVTPECLYILVCSSTTRCSTFSRSFNHRQLHKPMNWFRPNLHAVNSKSQLSLSSSYWDNIGGNSPKKTAVSKTPIVFGVNICTVLGGMSIPLMLTKYWVMAFPE